ncbi:MAG: hypothetical protein RB191_21545 [Terriglobia bacterium]|nr:hypothetical protein [Terriglobia bacterium]
MLTEVAGEAVAKANVAEKAKTQKQIIRDCLVGANGRTKAEDWLPGWMAFPAKGIGQKPLQDADSAPIPLAAE